MISLNFYQLAITPWLEHPGVISSELLGRLSKMPDQPGEFQQRFDYQRIPPGKRFT